MSLKFTTLAQDNFQRVNENPLSQGGNWSKPNGTFTGETINPLQVLNNQCVSSSPQFNYIFHIAQYTGVSFPNDQWAEFKVESLGLDGPDIVYVCIRSAVIGGVFATYFLSFSTQSSALEIGIFLPTSNVGVILNSTNITFNTGDVLRFAAVGTNFYAYQNGNLVLTATDGTFSSGSPAVFLVPQAEASVGGIGPAVINFAAGSAALLSAVGFKPNYYYDSYEAGLAIYLSTGSVNGILVNGHPVTVPANSQTYVWINSDGSTGTGASLGDGYPVALVTSGQVRTSGSNNSVSSGAVYNDGILNIQDLTQS